MYFGMMDLRMGETQKAERHTLFCERHAPNGHGEFAAVAYEWATTGAAYNRDGIVEMRVAGHALHEGLTVSVVQALDLADEHLTTEQVKDVRAILGDVGDRYSRDTTTCVWLIAPRPIGAEGDRLRQVMHMAAAVWRIVDAAVEGFMARNPGWEPEKNSWE